MNRPTGVTVIAVLYFVVAALCALTGILGFVAGGLLAPMIKQAGGAEILAKLGVTIGIIVLICAAVAALIGRGLWNLKSWARIVVIIFAALGLLGALLTLMNFSSAAMVEFVIRAGINGLILWYLLKPEVAAAFKG